MAKILFLINTLYGGGAEKVLIETVNSLDSGKHQITVQTVFDSGDAREKLSPNIRYKTIVPFKNSFLRKALVGMMIKACRARWIYNLLVREDYDYEISFLEGFPTKIISESTNKNSKKFGWVHTDLNAFPDSVHVFGSEENEKKAYERLDKVFCVSESVKNELQQKYGLDDGKVRVVYNIVDDEAIVNASKEAVELPSTLRPALISVGRLVNQKGYERLLRVHYRLIGEGHMHSLMIVGDGEDRGKLERYIRENQLCNTAFLLGCQDNPYKYMSKADLFVCSSYAEGYSTVVTESVLCSTPVLSTEVAGANEPANMPRCSIVVDNSEEALYESLRLLLAQPEKLEALYGDLGLRKAQLRKKTLLEEFERAVFS